MTFQEFDERIRADARKGQCQGPGNGLSPRRDGATERPERTVAERGREAERKRRSQSHEEGERVPATGSVLDAGCRKVNEGADEHGKRRVGR